MSAEKTSSFVWGDAPSTRAPRLAVVWDGGFLMKDLPATGSLTIGRSEECDVAIDHRSVSRVHARVHVAPLRIEDLGSSNGTRVDGHALAARGVVPLEAGSTIEIGAASLMVEAAAASPAAPRDGGNELERLLQMVAQSTISVILLGETGVGKDVAAESIHRRSPRAAGPIVRLNCAALSDALLESELFGHERGAFTGAVAAKVGLLEAATGGTLFLDEVGEMPATTQVKLLRALENREIVRVGAVRARPIDVRILAATHRDLQACIAEGSFRADLYFRLNGISIRVPPLRERLTEIPGLVATFVTAAGGTGAGFTTQALEKLASHRWPGNVRELRNVVSRALLLSAGGPVRAEHVVFDGAPPVIVAAPGFEPSPARSSGGAPADERTRIAEALLACAGNQTRAAKLVGLSRRAFVNRVEAFGLPRPKKS